jgi:hypothetical protein
MFGLWAKINLWSSPKTPPPPHDRRNDQNDKKESFKPDAGVELWGVR